MLRNVRTRCLKAAVQQSRRTFLTQPEGKKVPLFINGKFVESKTSNWIENRSPATQELLGLLPLTTQQEMQQAVQAAQTSFETWREVPLSSRVRLVSRFGELTLKYKDQIAKDLTREHGKTLADSAGEVARALEIVEHACTASARLPGGFVAGLSKEMDTYSWRMPLGVTGHIMPFNFPFMCPFWSIPLALVTGNTVVYKPTERCPQSALNIAKLISEAGFPDGVFNVIHGTHDAVNFICDAPDIKTISFVGSNRAGEHIWNRAKSSGKRMQINMGAKNHIVVMPDADKEQALSAVIGSAFGAAGQRCMANSVAVFVGSAKDWIKDLVEKCKGLKVTEGTQPGADFGPVITPEAKVRAVAIARGSTKQGAKLLLDGTSYVCKGFEKGNFIGPTVIGDVRADMECYTEEIFAPVLCTLSVESLDEAIRFVNSNPYGNGTAIMTGSGAAARKFQYEIDATQVGINIPIPVGLYFFGFTGGKKSFLGDNHFYGQDGFNFFTRPRTVISNWKYKPTEAKIDMAFPNRQ